MLLCNTLTCTRPSDGGVVLACSVLTGFPRQVIYEKLFAWLVGCINTCLSESDALSQLVESERRRIEGRFIGVLDIFGFEVRRRRRRRRPPPPPPPPPSRYRERSPFRALCLERLVRVFSGGGSARDHFTVLRFTTDPIAPPPRGDGLRSTSHGSR